ncbi:MAG TPA: DUF6542 domain-containing protein [Pseudonocardia sp.]|nr:DUF6542 domain-containing protein [Pseudonocardia sp.]
MTEPPGERPRRRTPGRPAPDPTAGPARRTRAGDADGATARRGAARSAAAKAGPAKGTSAKSSSPKGTPANGAPAKSGGRSGSGRTAKREKAVPAPEPAAADGPVRGAGGRWPMADRSVLPTVLGIPPLAAVGLAAALTAVGVLVDLTQVGGLGTLFTICHISGCVLAVAWVRRSGLFGPIVQPPLLVALSVPVVVLLAGSPRPGQGVAERLLVIGAPLVNAFPVMAWTTGVVLAFGLLRVLLQRPGKAETGRARGRAASRA